MDITYLGHSAFKLKTSTATVLTDPYSSQIGWSMPTTSAHIITVSHDHDDHNATGAVKGTARRDQPFVIDHPGSYELEGVSVFGTTTYHDDQGGQERGQNIVFKILIGGVAVCHLGDLGHTLTEAQLKDIGPVDVALVPVGGHFTIDAKQAVSVISQLEPSYVVPMHFKTAQHAAWFDPVTDLTAFLQEYGLEPATATSLKVEPSSFPDETELVLLTQS